MKKIISFAILILGIGYCSMAQEEEDENSEFGKQLKQIEQQTMKTKSDPNALPYIKAVKDAKTEKDEYVKKAPGYGEAAVSADKLKEFRKKLKKTDPKFQELVEKQRKANEAKREYFSSVNPEYKVIHDKLKAQQVENQNGKKKK